MEPMRDVQQPAASAPEHEEQAVVAGWKVHDYIQRFRIPLIVTVVVEMVLLILLKHDAVIWLMHLAVFAYLIVTTKDLTVQRASMLGALAGFFAGLGIAIFRLVFVRHAFYVLNLIAEPAITALLGGLFSAILFQFLRQQRERRARKAAQHNTTTEHKNT